MSIWARASVDGIPLPARGGFLIEFSKGETFLMSTCKLGSGHGCV